jgi:hypothetical protein
MSCQTTACPICDKTVSYAGKNKHLFSKTHCQDIQDAIVRRKKEFMIWIAHTEGKLTQRIPSIEFNQHRYKICFPCKKITETNSSYVVCPCKKHLENAQAIKTMLGVAGDPPVGVVEAAPAVAPAIKASPESGDEVAALKKELAMLNKKYKQLQEYSDGLEAGQEMFDACATAIGNVNGYDVDTYDVFMKELKKVNTKAFNKIKDSLNGIDE